MHIVQERILKLFNNQDSVPLNLRQIGKAIGSEHPQNVKHHLKQLEKSGLVRVDNNHRSITVLQAGKITDTDLIAVPIVGYANCGEATIYANEDVQGYLKLSKNYLRGKELIAIRASGNSMNRANINGKSIENGDYVIVNINDKIPQNGDYILSIIDGMANIKKFIEDKQNNQIVLLSESTENYSPIFIDPNNYDYLVNGKVINVLKSPNEQ